MNIRVRRIFVLLIICITSTYTLFAQLKSGLQWTPDGNSYYRIKDGNIVKTNPKTETDDIVVNKENLATEDKAINVASFSFSSDYNKVLIFTNTAKVWRYKTRGDYWVYDISTKQLIQIGKERPSQSLMFAKLSPDGKKAAYVSEHNIYMEDLASGKTKALTTNGTRKLINGTFDWVYEEEFSCRDGFRWSPDGSHIAFWQVDGTKTRDYYMLNTTDSAYSHVIPVEYPKVGEPPSPVRIGVVTVSSGVIKWMSVEGDPQQHYIPRMEWVDEKSLVVQQLDRRQQESKLIYCNAIDGTSYTFYAEDDDAWIDIKSRWNDDDPTGWEWLKGKQEFIWVSEKDGWRHLYKVSRDGKKEILLTNGKYDIESIKCIDETSGYIYFSASPENATQLYLYRTKLDGKSTSPELITPNGLKGFHRYSISPNGKLAEHSFSNHNTPNVKEWISLSDHKPLNNSKSIKANIQTDNNSTVEYIKLATEDGVTLDAWINKPKNFDSTKKYPVVMYVYGWPGSSVIDDSYGEHDNFLYQGDMSNEGYFQVGIDNRGTISLKGAAWRKAVYKKVGVLNIRDMAMGMKKLLEAPYFDKDRVAVWGWSGGGSSTLSLLLQYPEIFKTGIAIAPVTNMLLYDNIYTERYMGLPEDSKDAYEKGAVVTYAKNLQGNLLLVHGTGDDNVHYDNAEILLNALVKYNKQFQFMSYPNRTHSLAEGEGTRLHLSNMYTNFLKKNCPGGAK